MAFRIQRLFLWLAFLPFAILVVGEVAARVGNLPGVTRRRDPVLFCVPALHRDSPLLRRHPSYLWTFVPNTSFHSNDTPAAHNIIHIDQHGFRRTQWEYPGGDGIRWLFLGDSMVFCWETPTGETFPDALLGIVSKDHGTEKIAGFNLGIPAFSSYQSLRALQGEYSRVRPDIVIFWGGSNDNAPANVCSDRQFARLYGGLMFYVRRTLDSSAFIRWPRTLNPSAEDPSTGGGPTSVLRASRRVEPEEFRENVKEMATYSMRHGARFLALAREHVGRPEAIADYNTMLKQLENEDSVDVVEISDIYPRALDEGLMRNFPSDRCHFNARGYQLVAEKVADRITAEGWVETLLEKTQETVKNAG